MFQKKKKKKKQAWLLALFACILPITTIAFTYGALRPDSVETVVRGVNGDTVYIDDLDSDYYYYMGQNYTNSTDGSLPTLENKNIYSDANLVKTTVIYDGTSYDGKHTGYVSLTEQQSKYVYYKYYPQENGYIEIELIDNPFSDRPNDLAFNGWVTDYQGAEISYDSDYYKRYVRVPVGTQTEIEIHMYASWTNATVAYAGAGVASIDEAQNQLLSAGMHEIETVNYIYEYPEVAGYYLGGTITTIATKDGWFGSADVDYGTCTDCYDENTSYHTEYTCPAPSFSFMETGTKTNTCNVYYLQDENDSFQLGSTYYEINRRSFVDANLQPTIIGTEDSNLFDEESNMSGYYRQVQISYNQSVTGYYDQSGTVQSGTCTNRNGCSVYQLIQFYNSSGEEEILDPDVTYYYLTTRDTNIVVMTNSLYASWSELSNKPFTLTGTHNGTDHQTTWNVGTTDVTCYADTRIENLTISTTRTHGEVDPSDNNNSSATFYGNYHNVKLGRNIKKNGNYVNFTSAMGGRNSTSIWGGSFGSRTNPERYSFVVESGDYNSLSLTMGSSTGTRGTQLYTEMYGTYGNDYDRATANNTNLRVYFCASGSWGGRIYSSDDNLIPALNTTVKSGEFGTNEIDHTSGIYVGGRQGGTHYASRTAKVEGGYIHNLIGGPLTASSKGDLNDTLIYMTGGTVDMIVGGAGTSTTYGNRILQITGGLVNYSVFGGSNGYDGSSSDGTLTGDSYVYIGGVATIGNEADVNANSTLWGAEAGSVFGSGNGNSRYATIGSVDHSNIIIADQAVVRKNVYGSGNYGTVGYSSSGTSSTNIEVLGGTVVGSVFGSGNRSGSGRSGRVTSSIQISLNGGTVMDSIYGGSNQEGTVYGSSQVTLVNGTVKDTYGGGLGEETYVTDSVDVTVGNENTTSLKVSGSVYGGSAYGTVNASSRTNNVSNYDTTVTVNAGEIGNVFGGGKGDNTITPYVTGNVSVTTNGGTIKNLFGGNDASGEPNGEVVVYLNGGTIESAYGGGNNTLVSNTTVYQNQATVTNLYGGSNQSGNVDTADIYVSGGTTTNLYGGNNSGGTTSDTHIEMTSGIVTTMYGGGRATDTDASQLLISGGEIGTIYGGGERGSMLTSTDIDVSGGTIGSIYGGSNILGNVPTSDIFITNGTITEVYGGNNQGGVTTTTHVSLSGGTIETTYGGGNATSTTTSHVELNGSNTTNIYGGGNQAGVTTTNIDLITGTASYVFGGSNQSGTVDTTYIEATNPNQLSVENVYGGNNQGGLTHETNVTLNGGTYTNLYGGGNMAPTDHTHVHVDGIVMNGDFFGGGNQAAVNYDTDVSFKNSSISRDLFGGGNLGIVSGNTNVFISNSTISGSIYAGGNGNTAIVHGNTTLQVENQTVVDKHVFGGGNAANTGLEETNQSVSKVDIAGATIHGNVYGGANTAVLYGTVDLNIGAFDDSLITSPIRIDGTVFGGGEANASGDPNYDYSFISVTEGIDIQIDGANYDEFYIKGSIFGSGNASSTEGYSYIDISNYGTFENYQENISIQRADIVTLKNSVIKLAGTTDRTNEFSTTEFSISRVKELKIANDSTLFLDNGTNLLEKWNSLKIDGDQEEKATVTIADDGTVTKNVNNRVYMLEGKNMNIATNEAVTSYGEVSGMTFFGMYQLDRNDRVLTAFYDKKYEAGDTVASGEFYAFTSGSYVLGLHNTNHDITKDGFYSNYENEEQEGVVEVKYIEPTPSDASYYMWVIGETVTTYELTLTASKYATLGTYELPLVTSVGANTQFEILGFNYQNLEEGFQLVDPDTIERVNQDGTADQIMGLSMEASNNGFVTRGSTNFRTNEENPIVGNTNYQVENSSAVPSFIFYLYHSKNLTEQKELGTVVISLLEIKPIDEINNEVTRININVTINTALYSNNEYEGAMTSGEKYDLFASTQTNITNKSELSAYYSLYMETEKPYYQEGYQHALVSNYVLPLNTKITMIDLATTPTYYYHVIDEEDVQRATTEYQQYGESSYYFSDFIKMGSTSTDNNYHEWENMQNYYDEDIGIIQEEFIFIVDFGDTNIEGDQVGNSLLIELRNDDDQTLISVLGIQHANLTYNLYDNQEATIDVNGTLSSSQIYIGDQVNLDVTTNFLQSSVSGANVMDTTYFDKRLGIYITIYDALGNQLNNSSLLGLSYELDGITYYPRMDGSIRIPLADKVANVFSRIKVNTGQVNLATGSYIMRIESFGSPDGIYFGTTPSDYVEIPFQIINSRYGLDVSLDDKHMIIDKDTGFTKADNNAMILHVKYSSNLENPNIRISLQRRNYDNIYDTEYTTVNLLDYVSNNLVSTGENEYMLEENPTGDIDKFLYLKENLISGTYKIVLKLYDGDTYIGDCMEYVIIK